MARRIVVSVFLAEERHPVGGVEAEMLDEVARLNEHAARAARRVEHDAVVGLDHVDEHLHQRGRREELAIVLRALHCELHQEIFVDTPEHIAGGGAERRAVENAEQVSEDVVLELVVVLGKLTLQWLEVAFDRVHCVDDGPAEVATCRELEQRVVARFRRELEGAPFEEVTLDQRPLRHRAGGLVRFDLTDGIVVAVRRVTQKDDPQHGHAVFAAGEFGVGPEVIRGGPEVGFELFDVVHNDSMQPNSTALEHPRRVSPTRRVSPEQSDRSRKAGLPSHG